MKIFSYRSRPTHLILCLLILFCSTSTKAYDILDQSDVDLNLPPGWKSINITRNPGMIITTYASPQVGTAQEESLVEAQVTKQKGKDAVATINDMASSMNKQALDQHCQILDAIGVPQDNGQFKVWTQTYQCKLSDSAIVQVYVDADPQVIYMFTYTQPSYPFTLDKRESVNQLLKNSIQVCYKGKRCWALYSIVWTSPGE